MRIAAKPNEVTVEFNNPITASLFGTIVISISLLAAARCRDSLPSRPPCRR
jgi:hypothetical protein